MSLTLGLPSKGRLMADAIGWFAARGIDIAQTGQDREYKAAAQGLTGLEVVMLSAAEIPSELAAGRIHLGVTGEDLIRERLPMGGVDRVAKMGFGQADLVIAIPAFWVDVETMRDLDAACAEFRESHGQALRVATKYHNLTRAFFRRHGVADYRLVDSQGATEAGPANQTCEAIADITSTGATLEANHLRMLEDGLVLASEAGLWRSTSAEWTPAAKEAFRQLEKMLD